MSENFNEKGLLAEWMVAGPKRKQQIYGLLYVRYKKIFMYNCRGFNKLDFDDLMGEMGLALYGAIDNYTADGGRAFKNYLYSWIKKAKHDFYHNQTAVTPRFKKGPDGKAIKMWPDIISLNAPINHATKEQRLDYIEAPENDYEHSLWHVIGRLLSPKDRLTIELYLQKDGISSGFREHVISRTGQSSQAYYHRVNVIIERLRRHFEYAQKQAAQSLASV